MPRVLCRLGLASAGRVLLTRRFVAGIAFDECVPCRPTKHAPSVLGTRRGSCAVNRGRPPGLGDSPRKWDVRGTCVGRARHVPLAWGHKTLSMLGHRVLVGLAVVALCPSFASAFRPAPIALGRSGRSCAALCTQVAVCATHYADGPSTAASAEVAALVPWCARPWWSIACHRVPSPHACDALSGACSD